MKVRKLAAMLTLLAMVAALMPLTASVALGTGGNNPSDACYEEIHEDLYKRPKFKTEYQYQKQVKGDIEKKKQGDWRDVGDFDYEWYQPPTWKGGPTTKWSFQNVPVLESGNHDDKSNTWTQGGDTYRKDSDKYRYVKNGTTRQVPDGYEFKWVPDGQVPDGDGWVLVDERTRRGDRIPCKITDPTFDVTPESLVCNPQTGEIEGQNDGSITFHSFANGSWDATDQTGLSAGFYGPFWATSDPGYIFGSTGTDIFSTGKVEVGTRGGEEPCDKLTTAVDPEIVQSEVCEVEGTLTIPDTEGVQYLLDGTPIEAGVHSGPISGTLTAEAKDGYELTNPDFSVEVDIVAAEECPEVVTPVAPELVEASECGVPDRLIVPETGGVEYLLNGEDVSGQTLEGPLSGTIVAQPKAGHVFDGEQTVEYSFDLAGPEACPTTTTTTVPETTTTTVPETTTTTEPPVTTTEPEPEDPFASIDYWCDVDGLNLYLSEGEWQIAGWLLGERLWDHTFSVTEVNELGYAAFSLALEGADQFVVQTEGLSRVYVLDDCPEEPTPTTQPTPSTLPFTGDSTGSLAGVALIALVTGLGLVALSRKREATLD